MIYRLLLVAIGKLSNKLSLIQRFSRLTKSSIPLISLIPCSLSTKLVTFSILAVSTEPSTSLSKFKATKAASKAGSTIAVLAGSSCCPPPELSLFIGISSLLSDEHENITKQVNKRDKYFKLRMVCFSNKTTQRAKFLLVKGDFVII